ncbi:ribonuclease H-like domain-containing protein [Tanacetum coccineum]
MYHQGNNFFVPGEYAYTANVFQSHTTMLPQAFQTMTPQNPSWNMDTGASSTKPTYDFLLPPIQTTTSIPTAESFPQHLDESNTPIVVHPTNPPTRPPLPDTPPPNSSTPVPTLTFSLVVKHATIRTVLSLSVSRDWPIHHLDVKNAFLHGQLSETEYMHQPRGFADSRFASFATRIGFHHNSKTDASLFVYHRGSDIAYLLLYVDDIILTASSTALLQRIIDSLHGEFAMTDLGSLNYFLGISAQRNAYDLFLSQSKFAEEILERAHMEHCNPCRTPVDTESKIGPEGVSVVDPTLYRCLAGALQYLTFTRPNLSYVVQQICLYMHDPREPHLLVLKRVLRYVRGTLDHGLQLHASSMTQLVAYTDADWAGCPVTRRSTSGYCVFLGDNLLSWSAKRQVTLSRSSAEAEYRGVANVVAETAWIRNLLRELHTPLFNATLVYCDNVSAVYMSTNPVQHQRTKHIEIDIQFVRDYVASGEVRVLHVPSRFNFADIFTKGLPSALFIDFRSSLNVRRPPAQTAGDYVRKRVIDLDMDFQNTVGAANCPTKPQADEKKVCCG